MIDKKSIRDRVRVLRGSYSRCAEDSASICSAVKDSETFCGAGTVLIYWPLPGEVDLTSLVGCAGKRFVLPVVKGDTLVLREYSPELMISGFRGIMEPSEAAAEVDPSEIEFALVPGVAFAALPGGGYMRLGRGGGFYDRLLPELNCPVAGVAFDFQLFDALPSESFDRPVDFLFRP